jgi:hypothetical protein
MLEQAVFCLNTSFVFKPLRLNLTRPWLCAAVLRVLQRKMGNEAAGRLILGHALI